MIFVAAAGGLGAASRFLVDALVARRTSSHVAWGTAVVNVTGSFLLGLVVAYDANAASVIGTGLLSTGMLCTGFLGGFTTFGTASFETARLALSGRRGAAATYGLGVLVVSVAAASAGYLLACGQLRP